MVDVLKRLLRDRRGIAAAVVVYLVIAWLAAGLWFALFTGGLLMLAIGFLAALGRRRVVKAAGAALLTLGVGSVALGYIVGAHDEFFIKPAVVTLAEAPKPAVHAPTTTTPAPPSPTATLPVEPVDEAPVEEAPAEPVDDAPAEQAPVYDAPVVPEPPVEQPAPPADPGVPAQPADAPPASDPAPAVPPFVTVPSPTEQFVNTSDNA